MNASGKVFHSSPNRLSVLVIQGKASISTSSTPFVAKFSGIGVPPGCIVCCEFPALALFFHPVDLAHLQLRHLVTCSARSFTTDVLRNYASNALLQLRPPCHLNQTLPHSACPPLITPSLCRSDAIVIVAVRCRLNVAYAWFTCALFGLPLCCGSCYCYRFRSAKAKAISLAKVGELEPVNCEL